MVDGGECTPRPNVCELVRGPGILAKRATWGVRAGHFAYMPVSLLCAVALAKNEALRAKVVSRSYGLQHVNISNLLARQPVMQQVFRRYKYVCW